MRPSRTLVLAFAAASAAVGLGLVLTGCVPQARPSASPSASDAPSLSPSVSPPASPAGPSPSASASTSARASTPVQIPCTTLVSNDTVYQYGPIYSAKSPFTPPPGSAAAQARADRGTVCEWINTSSGTTIDLSVGRYSGATLAAQKRASADGAQSASGWGGDVGYFATSGGIGVATAFVGGYWLVTASPEFGSAADADPFMTSAVTALRSR